MWAARQGRRTAKGVNLAYKGLFDEANRSFQSALSAKPGWQAARLALGSTFLAKEQWSDAVTAMQNGEETKQIDPLWHAILAISLVMNGDYKQAVKSWEQAVKQAEGKDKEAAREALEAIQVREDAADEALKSLEKAVTLRPEFTKAYFNLGVLNDQLHRYDLAIFAYEKVVSMAPDIPIGHFRLGVAYHRMGRTQAAQQAIQQYIQLVTDPMLLPQVETFLKRMN
jgi:tetratricopeptide (TPR) repeat protein